MTQNTIKSTVCDQSPVEKIMYMSTHRWYRIQRQGLEEKSKENPKLKNRKTFTVGENRNISTEN